MKRFYLTEASVRILSEIARAYRAGKLGAQAASPPRMERPRRDMPYTPAVYRLATNDGDGAYTLRKQEWDAAADAEEMIDIPDEYDPDYKLDIKGYDYRGRADGVAGAAGTGQIVRGWKIWHIDDWITLVDVAEELRISSGDTAARHARRTAAELAAEPTLHHKIIGDSEVDAAAATTGGNIKVEIINPGADEQAKINHIPPDKDHTVYQQPWSNCASLAMTDANGHPLGWYYYVSPDWVWYSPWGYAAPSWSPPF